MEMTMKLVKKDILHLGYSLKSIWMMWVTLCTCLPLANFGFAVVMPALGAYITFNSMRAYEERNKGDLLTGALPVTRVAICSAYYIEVLLYIIGGSILSAISLGLRILMNDMQMAIAPFIGIMIIVGLVYTSVIVPVLFYFGTAKARYVLLLTYIIVFMGASNAAKMDTHYVSSIIEKLNSGIGGILIFLIAIVMWIISYFISLNIFKNKDYK